MSDASMFKIKGEGNTVDTPEAGQCIDWDRPLLG